MATMGFQQRKYSRAIFNLGEFSVHDASTLLPGDVGPPRRVTVALAAPNGNAPFGAKRQVDNRR
jgi:hypothetical protein